MPLVIPENYAAVIHSLTLAGDPEPMAVTYGVANAALGGTADDIANQAAAAFDNVVVAGTTALSLTSTEVRFQDDPPPADPEIGVSTTTAVGTNAGTILPQNCAFLVHKRSSVGGRAGRGRFYLPGPREGDVSNLGVLESGVAAYWQPILDAFLAALEASASIAGMVILHDSLGAHAADPPAPVTSLVIDPRIATQRRRLRR